MKRANIIAKGKVQKVGCRDFVQDKIKYGDVPEELGDDRLGAALLYLGAANQKLDAGFKMLAGKMDEGREENIFSIRSIPSTIFSIDAANENRT